MIIHMEKNEIGSLLHTVHNNLFQMAKGLKLKDQTLE